MNAITTNCIKYLFFASDSLNANLVVIKWMFYIELSKSVTFRGNTIDSKQAKPLVNDAGALFTVIFR